MAYTTAPAAIRPEFAAAEAVFSEIDISNAKYQSNLS
jgi:hypothetical protein